MKEIKDIIAAYDAAVVEGKKAALATVVHVEGSSYRRPGARMLVTEDGMLTGAISGGCLEGDALRKAQLAIFENKNKLVTYDTTDEGDASFGVQLGCNGIVHILFEPLNNEATNAVDLLKTTKVQRHDAAIVTLFSLSKRDEQPGTMLSITTNNITEAGNQVLLSEELKQALLNDATTALKAQASLIKSYTRTGEDIHAFIQVVTPAVSLVIFGAGNDAMPLVSIANMIGWETTVIDGRHSHATQKRFPQAEQVIIAKPDTALDHITIDRLTFFVLMTHNYNYDIKILHQLLQKDCRYIGVLGPRQKLDRMFDELSADGLEIRSRHPENIFSPVGLDLGAETAEEIALSIAGEIEAVLTGRDARSLRLKEGSIHNRNEAPIINPIT